MIRLGVTASSQLADFLDHCDGLGRTEAARNLLAAVDQAATRIEADPAVGVPAPRPYPDLARPGVAWLKSGRYWIAYTVHPPTILAVFYEHADIRGRL